MAAVMSGFPSVRRLGWAPHRLLFFVGAGNLLLAMAWWAAWLIGQRFPGAATVGQPEFFAGWLHAFIMQYQVLPTFMAGFLLTVFPRWMALTEATRWHYLPVGAGLLLGQALMLAGAATASPSGTACRATSSSATPAHRRAFSRRCWLVRRRCRA